MNTTSLTMIRRMNAEVEAGRPFWALLRLNEWDNTGCPVMAAARKRAAKALETAAEQYQDVSEIVTKIIAGARMNDLSTEEQAQARQVRETAVVVRRQTLEFPALRVRPARNVRVHAAR